MRRARTFRLAVQLAAAALVTGCGSPSAPVAERVVGDDEAVDPLLASVVNDPLMTDLQLTTRSNSNAVRPPDAPPTLMIPLADAAPVIPAPIAQDEEECTACAPARTAPTLAALANRQDDARLRACAPTLGYAAGWAARFAADLPLPASARVVEAGGVDRSDCTIRAAAFTAAVTLPDFAQDYAVAAQRSGYAVDRVGGRGEVLLRGRRARDGAAFTLYARAAGQRGVDARLVANTGA